MPQEEVVAGLLAQFVPEIAVGDVEIKAIARRPGLHTKLAVRSRDAKLDCIGACVGVRGSRIIHVVDLLDGERIELVRWHDQPESLIRSALQPAAIEAVILHPAEHRATVVVQENQLSLALGRDGLNRELASRICGWEIEVVGR